METGVRRVTPSQERDQPTSPQPAAPPPADAGRHPVPGARIRPPRVTGLSRERLLGVLQSLWDHRLGLVVAPAGSGKSTLLAQFAAELPTPAVWYRAESSDVDAQVMLGHLEAAWTAAVGPTQRAWATVDDAALALESAAPQRVAIIIDDLHVLRGTPAEAALERLLDYLPDGVAVLAATRALPAFNLSRLRVSDALLEVAADDLRFRSWEVERLFRDVYAEPLRPEDLAELARRTEGWAAGLKLFHLATKGKSRGERERAVAALGHRSRLVREYLARNVLDELDDGLRDFLLRTAVLGRLNGYLCDELLGRTGSAAVLAELEREQLFTIALDEPGWYRYHEVLRTHAESVFVEEAGAERARSHSRRAGALLEGAGAFVEALQAYCRADDWAAAERLLALSGEQLTAGPGPWVDSLPESMFQHDPWVMLAAARRQRGAGRLVEAQDTYRRAEAGFGTLRAADICRQERQALTTWCEPSTIPPADWSGLLRLATLRQPLAIAGQRDLVRGPATELVAGLALLLAGRVVDAAEALRDLQETTRSPAVSAAALLATGICDMLGGGGGNGGGALEAAVEEAEKAAIPWLAAIARSLTRLALTGDLVPDDGNGGPADPWGRSTLRLLEAMVRLRSGRPAAAVAADAGAGFAAVGAPVLEAWCAAIEAVALVREGGPDAAAGVTRAERLARSSATTGPAALAVLAGAFSGRTTEPGAVERAFRQLTDMGLELGLDAPPRAPAPRVGMHEAEEPAELSVTLFGHFSITLSGRPVDVAATKPRVRSLLRLLAVNAGRAVHRERIVDALWPDADAETGTRNLQVAISTLRQVLEPGVARGESSLLIRDGDAYLLAASDGADIDALAFQKAAMAGQEAVRAGDAEQAIAAFTRALELYTGDLVPEEGPAEWLIEERESYRTAVVEAAFALAELHAERGELVAAAFACERGLRVDRYRDGLWRLLIDLYERGGEAAAAARAREQYAAILVELGVESTET